MKRIDIEGEVFKCDVKIDSDGNIPISFYTIFYKEYKEVEIRCFPWFWKKTKEFHPIELFRIPCFIIDPNYTKEEMNKKVKNAYRKWKSLINRHEEISNGELI